MKPIFYIGLHMPSHAPEFDYCMVSVNRLRKRKKDFYPKSWIMDSGAFTEISKYGSYRSTVEEYAKEINRWKHCGELRAAVAQDYMCQPFILNITGLTVEEHQRLTIERYDQLVSLTDAYIMPVLQGYTTQEFVSHLRQYGDRFKEKQWVGIGSLRRRSTFSVEKILMAIKEVRPDLQLHGFGVKMNSLKNGLVSAFLYSCDSMAWSFHGRINGLGGNDPKIAAQYEQSIKGIRLPAMLQLYEGMD